MGIHRDMGFRVSQNLGYFFGVSLIRIIIYEGLSWVCPISGNYHLGDVQGLCGGYIGFRAAIPQ